MIQRHSDDSGTLSFRDIPDAYLPTALVAVDFLHKQRPGKSPSDVGKYSMTSFLCRWQHLMAPWHDVVTTLLRLLRSEDLNLDLYSSALYYVFMISDTPPFPCHQFLVHFRREEEERTTILRVYHLVRTQVRPSSAVASNLIRECDP